VRQAWCALHDFLKIFEETKSLHVHIHDLPGIRNAIPLLIAGASGRNR
jgi:hypothetical protein